MGQIPPLARESERTLTRDLRPDHPDDDVGQMREVSAAWVQLEERAEHRAQFALLG
jgi:hypothetical protein